MKNYKLFLIFGIIVISAILLWSNSVKETKDIINTSESISLIIPEHSENYKDSIKDKSIKLKIKQDLTYFLDGKQIEYNVLEKTLIDLNSLKENSLTIVLQAEEFVPVNKVVEVMEIANHNKLKMIIAVKPN